MDQGDGLRGMEIHRIEQEGVMDEVQYMSIIYNAKGMRVAYEVDPDLNKVSERAPVTAKAYGPGYTFKLFECREIKPK